MTTPYLPGLIRIQWQMSDEAGRVDEIIWHSVLTGSPAPLTLAQLVNIQTAVNATWNTGSTALSPLIASSYHFNGSIITDQQSATGLQASNAGFTPIPGGDSSGPALPRQVAGVISLQQASRYRGGKGRSYVPGIGNNNINTDGKTMPNTVAQDLGFWINAVATALDTTASPTSNFVILRARTQVTPHTVPKTYLPPFTVPVSGFFVSGVYGTQRRRIRKVAHT